MNDILNMKDSGKRLEEEEIKFNLNKYLSSYFPYLNLIFFFL